MVDKSNVDSIEYERYKVFIVPTEEEINFIGRTIPDDLRFNLTTNQAKITNDAINNQYAEACINQYFIQQNTMRLFSNPHELQDAKDIYRRTKKKANKNYKKDEKNKIHKFDRYLYGIKNSNNEHLVLIRFDPHKIEWYSIPGSGESHIDVLQLMVYNIDQNILRVSE